MPLRKILYFALNRLTWTQTRFAYTHICIVQLELIHIHPIYLYTYPSSLFIHSSDFGRVDLTLSHFRSFVLWCFIWFDSDLIGIIHISTHVPLSYFEIVFSVVLQFFKTLWTICDILIFQESGL